MLKTKIGPFEFDNCLMNASGLYCSDIDELRDLSQSQAGSFISKTATLEAREGNAEPRIGSFEFGSINSAGLPNHGIDYYLDAIEEIQGENPGKKYFLSVTEMSQDNIQKILKKVNASSFQGLVELNLSCPNVEGKAQVAYDFDLVNEILEEAFSSFEKPLGVKLSPYFDLAHFDQMADILNKYPLTYLNSINSIGNGLVIRDEKVVIKPKNGFGGLGGACVKPTALANVHAFYQRLKPEIDIIGTGGVSSGRDAFEHILCGASMVQIGTGIYPERAKVFARISQELEEIMVEKGYQSLDDFKGKLQYL